MLNRGMAKNPALHPPVPGSTDRHASAWPSSIAWRTKTQGQDSAGLPGTLAGAHAAPALMMVARGVWWPALEVNNNRYLKSASGAGVRALRESDSRRQKGVTRKVWGEPDFVFPGSELAPPETRVTRG
jgi:hypothetical protein